MELQVIQNRIFEIRGYRVILDFDLAELYETETKKLKQAVRRNMNRFPSDFMFELNDSEWDNLRSQIMISKGGRGRHSKYPPFAFTEQGVAMLASVLHSQAAIDMNIQIVRAFVLMRQFATNYEELMVKLEELEQSCDAQFGELYQALTQLLSKAQNDDNKRDRPRVGFKF